MASLLAGIALGVAVAGPPGPEATFCPSPENPPKGEKMPAVVRSGDRGAAYQFVSAQETRLPAADWQLQTIHRLPCLTIVATIQLEQAPRAKCAIVSRWQTVDGGRSFELGVYPSREVFFDVSGTGNWDAGAREVKSEARLRVGRPYVIAAIFEPGKRMAVYVNGHLAGESRAGVPKGLFVTKTPCYVGNRPGDEKACGFDGLVYGVALYGWLLDEAWVKRNAAETAKLTEAPEPLPRDPEPPPVRAITKGPKFHWFTYYDRPQFDPTCRYALGLEVDFEHRSPKPDDVIKIGMVDTQDGDRWIELGESRAWCWQQGPMLQWRPGSKSEILWNDREGDRFVCHILDVFTRKRRTIPHPVYGLSPDGRISVAPDFQRLHDTRPGYGYAGPPDPWKDEAAPRESGLWRVDLETGEARLIVSFADMLKIPFAHGDVAAGKHWFNVVLFSPDGRRFLFLDRWTTSGRGSRWFTRMLTASAEGRDIRVVDGDGRTSHLFWRDPTHILAWAWHPSHQGAFYLHDEGTGKAEPVARGVLTHDGHCSYLPGGEWILNDTYPTGPRREQHVFVYHVATGKLVSLGRYHSPPAYTGEWRCDTHPRFSPDGKLVCFDSPHGGNGRQMYLVDIGALVAAPAAP
ncbi:MAG TPA: LamG-like jellyroll fold domain-containing protein [Planctomycetota bacterium]|nr:LamG-like jellyroll fold domain-containing protein [Planctomycetota bacterium]